MATAKKILSDALELPVEDRARLARELLRSLDESSDEEVVETWTEELRRRLEEIDQGRVATLDLDEVKSRMAARRAERRAKSR